MSVDLDELEKVARNYLGINRSDEYLSKALPELIAELRAYRTLESARHIQIIWDGTKLGYSPSIVGKKLLVDALKELPHLYKPNSGMAVPTEQKM